MKITSFVVIAMMAPIVVHASRNPLRRGLEPKSSGKGKVSGLIYSSDNDPALSDIPECQDSSTKSPKSKGSRKSPNSKGSTKSPEPDDDVCGNSERLVNPTITPGTILGNGNIENNFWTCQQTDDIELCLRAKQRWPTPRDPDGSYQNPDGSFRVPTGGGPAGTNAAANANWNFEWHVNVDRLGATGDKISDWDFRLVIDSNPGCEVCAEEYFQFVPGFVPADHDFGDNLTGNSQGTTWLEYCGANPTLCTTPEDVQAAFELLQSENNVAQNSQNLGFFRGQPGQDTGFQFFDPTKEGIYEIALVIGKFVDESPDQCEPYPKFVECFRVSSTFYADPSQSFQVP